MAVKFSTLATVITWYDGICWYHIFQQIPWIRSPHHLILNPSKWAGCWLPFSSRQFWYSWYNWQPRYLDILNKRMVLKCSANFSKKPISHFIAIVTCRLRHHLRFHPRLFYPSRCFHLLGCLNWRKNVDKYSYSARESVQSWWNALFHCYPHQTNLNLSSQLKK